MAVVRRALFALALLVMPAGALAQTPAPPPAVTSADRILGRADAPVTVIEYASFVCSHCAHWHTTVLPAFKARFVDTGQVRVVFRDLPTPPVPVGELAAGIGRCAVPAHFFDVATALMTGQAALLDGAPIGDWLSGAVAVSGKSPDQIQACLADPATLAGIRAETAGAAAAGVRGTPSFFVNGQPVMDSSLEGLGAAIRPNLPRP